MGQLSIVGSIIYYVSTFGFSAIISKTRIQNSFVKFLLIIIPPIILATFRYNVGYDYNSYVTAYNNSLNTTLESILTGYKIGDPIAYYLVTKIAAIFHSERIFLMILALLSILPGTIYILNEWKDKKTQAMMLFIFLFNPFIFSFSACKQGIALSMLMFSLKYVFNRNFFKFIICVTIAFLFHSTAIAFLPVYLFLNKKGELSILKKVIIILVCLFIIMNLELILGNIFEGRYETYALDIVEGKNRTFWLYSGITIIFLAFRRKLISIDKRNDLLVMMMIVGTIAQFLGFSNAFAKRIGEYFIMAQVFLIPQCIYLFKNKDRNIVNILIVLYVIAIFLISSPIAASGMGFIPYQFKWK